MRADDLLAKAISKAADEKAKRATKVRAYTLPAEYVGKDSQGKGWVLLPGADSPTPVRRMAVEANAGDTVSVTVGYGRAVVDANISNPSAGVVSVKAVGRTAQRAQNTAEAASKDAQAAIGYSKVARTAANDAAKQAESATESARIANQSANSALEGARIANDAANSAVEDAKTASENADIAVEKAVIATESANTAQNKLSDVERVVGTVNWIADHGSYMLTTDTEVNPRKVYYQLSGGDYLKTGDTVLDPYKQYYSEVVEYSLTADAAVVDGKAYYAVSYSYDLTEDEAPVEGKTYYVEDDGGYAVVSEPDASDIATYYERAETYTQVSEPSSEDIATYYERRVRYEPVREPDVSDIGSYFERRDMTADVVQSPTQAGLEGYFTLIVNESVENYVNSHVFLDDDGLYVKMTDNGYKARVDADSFDIVDPNGNVVSSYGSEGVRIGKVGDMGVLLTADRLAFVDRNGNEAAYIKMQDSNFSVMYISRSVVVEDMQFGLDPATQKCRWKWYSRANGNMALKWMGE